MWRPSVDAKRNEIPGKVAWQQELQYKRMAKNLYMDREESNQSRRDTYIHVLANSPGATLVEAKAFTAVCPDPNSLALPSKRRPRNRLDRMGFLVTRGVRLLEARHA
jgi:hypothetical protein